MREMYGVKKGVDERMRNVRIAGVGSCLVGRRRKRWISSVNVL